MQISQRWSLFRWIRPVDLLWLLLFATLHWVSPLRNPAERMFLMALAIFQVVQPRVKTLNTAWGNVVSITLKLVLSYMLIGYTGGVTSSHYLILLLPVVSAATTLGWLGTAIFTALSVGAYASFLLFLDWDVYVMFERDFEELSLRSVFLVFSGFLVYTLSEELRLEARRNLETARLLADANASLRRAEGEVRRGERLAALGQLTAGLAHEIRNPLGAIHSSADLLARVVPADNEIAQEMSANIRSEVDRANQIITKFLQFASPTALSAAREDLTVVVDRAIALVKQARPAIPCAIYTNYLPDIPPVRMDSTLMERVFFNLLMNAAQASGEGCVITVRTKIADGFAEVAVIDRGAGVPKEDIDNIFNPFFTTKATGTGLGLSVVSRIVDLHGGKILVESELGSGSTFRVLLPLES